MSDTATATPTASAPAPSAAPVIPSAAPASSPATSGAPAAQTATPSAPQASATQAPGIPEGYVPSYRLRERGEQLERKYREQLAEYQRNSAGEVQQLRQQLQALVGAQPQQNPEIAAVRDQFGQLFPKLMELEERAQDLLGLVDRAGDFDAATSHQWLTYGRQTMDRLYSQAEKELGGPLSNEAKAIIHGAFTNLVASSPELQRRYAEDPSFADEWFKQSFAPAFIAPAQRSAAATVQGRTAQVQQLPNVAGGAIPGVAQPPKPKDLDERAAAAWAQFQTQRG